MKKRINMIAAVKRAQLWATVLLAGSLFIGCTKDIQTELPGAGSTDPDMAVVVLSVNTPQPTLPSALTRSQTESETRISDAVVLVFEKSGAEYRFSYHVKGTGVAGSGSGTQFSALLAGVDVPVKLVILANSAQALTDSGPRPGDTEAHVKSMLEVMFQSQGIVSDLPMYGEVLLENGIETSETYVLPVTVLRAVARVDIVKELNAGSPEFIMEEVHVFRANDRFQLIPNALSGGDMPKVSSPSVPQDASALESPLVRIYGGGTESITQIYIPESAAAVSNSEKIRHATTVVIGGRFGGPDSPVSYYRADFNSGIQGHPFGQVLRNHRYIFKIKSVSREGWPSPGEAAENLSSSIIVDVHPWEDFSSEMYLGDDRFGISSRDIALRFARNRSKTLDVESTFLYDIQWVKDGVAIGEPTSDLDTPIGNGNFTVEIFRRPGDKENISHLRFTTLTYNNLGEIKTDTLRITAGPWKVDVTVRQDNTGMYSSRYMNILTVATLGNLGVDMVSSDASGLAMRKVLDAQFAPSGIMRIGGSSFTRIPNNTNYIGTTESANMAVLNRIFGGQDVIYFPYEVIVSSPVADLLITWLESSPHRVLIVGTDSDATNRQLRLKAKLAADGTWAFTGVGTITSNYARAAETPESEEFFNGPFGQVPANATFRRADATAGYINSPGTGVTPLIRGSNSGYENYMFFGVNKANRIIYHGDSQLFQTDQMSNNSGNVTSDLDKLMGNTWAWITEQVIYGDN